MMSAYKIGWIGIRIEKMGKAKRLLKKQGWMEVKFQLNNRNGFNWMRPGITREKFQYREWSDLANVGMQGIAFWITDAQWGAMAGLTAAQWNDRRIIEDEFNSKFPNGKRI